MHYAAGLLPLPEVPVVEVIPKPWPRPPRRCEGDVSAQRSEELTGQRRSGRKHREGIHGDPIRQRKDENHVRILLQNPGGIGFVTGRRNRESLKIEKLKKFIIEKETVDVWAFVILHWSLLLSSIHWLTLQAVSEFLSNLCLY